MKKINVNNLILLSLAIMLFSYLTASAGTTGKIAGKVTDKLTGDPLPSANVIVVGENIGAAANMDGNYIILNVRPGTYTVKVSMLGYSSALVEGVVVRADLTSNIDVELSEAAAKIGEIVVTADKKMIIKDETSRTATVNSKELLDLPINSFQDVVSLQAGFVTGSDGELHARGGRSNEIAYLIDGIPVKDALSGGISGEVDKYAIEELQVLTGGYNAEYGQALSGVVNIVTKEGGNNYNGRIEYTSPNLNESPYRKADALALDEWGFDENGNFVERTDPKGLFLINGYPSAYQKQTYDNEEKFAIDPNIPGQLSAVLGGPIPYFNELKFFTTARYENMLSQLPWGYNKAAEFNGKLTYRIGSVKLLYSMQRLYTIYKPYSHQWKYAPQGYETRKSFVWRDNLKINHVLSSQTFYEASISFNRNYFNRYTPGRYAEFSPDGELLSSNYIRKNNSTPPFWTNADNGLFIKNDVSTILGKFDFTSQLGQHNLIKTGIEIRDHKITRLRFQEPYEGGFHGLENYVKYPFEFSVYVQDKLEFNAFIINAGVRFDYVDVNDTQWQSVRQPAGYIGENQKWITTGEVPTPPKKQISPRLGISFPITDKTVFYSSYGHFFQIPDYADIYTLRDPTQDRAIIGNPGINAQKTVAFEFGVKQEIGFDYYVNVSAYFKDITDLEGSTYFTVFPYEYTIFDNSNYGGVQGFEVSFNKRLSSYWYANFNYTYSVAKGNESDPREGFNDYRRASSVLRPKQVFFLDFDREHVFTGSFGLEFPKSFGPSLSGIHPLENLGLNLVVKYMSGLPYTPVATGESEALIIEKNSDRMPAFNQVDLKLTRSFDIVSSKLTFFLIVTNLFDAINATTVWSTSGDPLDAGPTYNRTEDRMRNPSNIDVRRSVQLGARFDF